ncbi:MAG: DUF3105 domain-containing protein [Chloroflexota bacterium]|nr:MAG: DUF3105 domain-containing protein [Chloroflexota bacterium]
MAFLNATSPAYACSTEWEPAVTPEPAPSATPRIGYVQNDMGREHVTLGSFVRYALCPPASGKHVNAQGEGPVRPGTYGPDDQATPGGWIHNLEHGGLVVLYRCESGDSGCSDTTQSALQAFYASFPNSPVCDLPAGSVGPIIARFDEMKWPFAALLWGQVLPLDTLDTQLILDFFAQQGERSNPEALCAAPTPTPAPTGTPGPTGSPAPSGSAEASASPEPTASPAPAATSSPAPSATPAAS